jgi:NAD(P)-dependent dehydrogenase (short-subunit alcohol dehydrogenase family)
VQDFQGRTAVVTGAASGIGLALATRLAAEGMRVVLADVEAAPLRDLASEMTVAGYEVLEVQTDVADADSVHALADAAYDRFGSVELLCNNAGVLGDQGLVWERPTTTWQWVVGVNLMGVVHGIQAFVPRMLAAGKEGHIVNTASVAAFTGLPFSGVYCATKHAVLGVSDSLRAELTALQAPIGVTVLCPGVVRTNIADGDRNRPASLAPSSSSEDSTQAALVTAARSAFAAGLDPDDVAGQVVRAVRDEQFVCFTDADGFKAAQRRERAVAKAGAALATNDRGSA